MVVKETIVVWVSGKNKNTKALITAYPEVIEGKIQMRQQSRQWTEVRKAIEEMSSEIKDWGLHHHCI